MASVTVTKTQEFSIVGAEGLAQWSGAHTALADDLGSTPDQ